MNHTTYEQVMPGVYKITPCTCNQCMQEVQAQEQRLENILKKWDEFAKSHNRVMVR